MGEQREREIDESLGKKLTLSGLQRQDIKALRHIKGLQGPIKRALYE